MKWRNVDNIVGADNIYTYLEFSTKNGAIAQRDKGGDLISRIFHPDWVVRDDSYKIKVII